MNVAIKIKYYLTYIRLLPSLILLYSSSECKNIVFRDVQRWVHMEHMESHGDLQDLVWILAIKKETRNIYYCRLKKWYPIAGRIVKVFLPELDSFYINESVDFKAGLWPAHAFSTIVWAKCIEENVSIYQQVTIGDAGGAPTLHKGVTVCCGAKVLGPIEIGENSTIGAGAVVTKSVPKNCVVVGNPAMIIRRDGVKVKEKL